MAEATHPEGRLVERLDLVIAGRVPEFARVSAAIDALAARHGLPDDVLADLQVSADEVLANIVHYAWDHPEDHRVEVRLELRDDAIVFSTSDDGRPFDPVAAHAGRSRSRVVPERTPGGRGLRLVFALMSEVRYTRSGDNNRLQLVRRRDRTAMSAAGSTDARGGSREGEHGWTSGNN